MGDKVRLAEGAKGATMAKTGILGSQVRMARLGRQVRTVRLGRQVTTASVGSKVGTVRLGFQPPQGKEGRRQAAPAGLPSVLAMLLARALLLWRWIH